NADHIKEIMTVKMHPAFPINFPLFAIPDTPTPGDIHVLVLVPKNEKTVLYWLVDCTVQNALETKGVRRRVYRLLNTNLAYYDPSLRSNNADVAVEYVGSTLKIHALFEMKEHALIFQYQLLDEPITAFSALNGLVVSANVTQVSSTAAPMRRIFLADYHPQESESPQDTFTSISASVSIIDVMTDEFKYQRIEGEHCFGPIGKAESCHIMSK
ncbi:Crinkler (CRN) family protein, partial [Thraustotheca clavata]